jgi:hypothetical protein
VKVAATREKLTYSPPWKGIVCLAEFEPDLVRERVRYGLAAAKARGQKLGRQPGQRIKADCLGSKVLRMVKPVSTVRCGASHNFQQLTGSLAAVV